MTTTVSSLNKDTFGVILNFLTPRDCGRVLQVCRIWKKFVTKNQSINEQIEIIQRLPKILQQNLPNCKLPVLHIGGVVVPPNPKTKMPLLRFGGEDNWPSNKIDIVTPDMMTHPIMFIKDPLNRVGVALKYTFKTESGQAGEGAIVLHEVGGKEHKGKWTAGQDNSELILHSRFTARHPHGHSGETPELFHAFPRDWPKENISQVYLPRLLKGESCGLTAFKIKDYNFTFFENEKGTNSFIRLSL